MLSNSKSNKNDLTCPITFAHQSVTAGGIGAGTHKINAGFGVSRH